MHETYPWLLHIICICNKTKLILPESLQSAARHYMDIFCLILSNFLSTYFQSFQFACIFLKFRYNIECDSKSITKCEQRHSELIIIKFIKCTFASQTRSKSRQFRLCHSTCYYQICCVTKTIVIIQLRRYKRIVKNNYV